MRLFIAEKPSMGREISKCLPEQKQVQRKDGYIIQGDDVVTWAFGHVLEQAQPGDYEDKWKKWNAADLPIVPNEWKLLVTKSSEKQFKTIKNLINHADIIVNAGDPDREGQLLIDEILEYVHNKKPVERILLNALDEKSVKTALADLRDNKDFHNLQQSALARSRADWLIGMNLSRAYTLAAQRRGERVVFPIGRVKTPTLALVVRRERELADFKPVTYYVLKVQYEHKNGLFWATWQPKDTQAGLDADGHLVTKPFAEELAKKLPFSQGLVSKCQKTKKKESPRLPLSLSALQVEAGKAYGYDPQTVLDTAQKLYERKLTSYPRSDCDYLPTNQYKDRLAIIKNLGQSGDKTLMEWAQQADTSLKSRAWNTKKITAHHAIIPTTVPCQLASLSETERNIYFLVSRAYIAQFYPDHIYEQTKIEIDQEEETFLAHGRVVKELGWKALYKRKKKDEVEEISELPLVKKGDPLQTANTAIDEKQTKPPSRFTPSTLLQAMKEIYKYVKNDALKAQLKEVSGIGTEATRATIIDELISRGFMKAKGKKKTLTPTNQAYALVDALPDEMLYPDETAVWEERLALMSDGKDHLDAFLKDQIQFLTKLVEKANTDLGQIPQAEICPSCKKGRLQLRQGKFGAFKGCSNYPDCKYTEPVSSEPVVKQEKIDKNYKCPRCQDGYFVQVEERGRKRWVCSNTAHCRTSCADVDGVPSLFSK